MQVPGIISPQFSRFANWTRNHFRTPQKQRRKCQQGRKGKNGPRNDKGVIVILKRIEGNKGEVARKGEDEQSKTSGLQNRPVTPDDSLKHRKALQSKASQQHTRWHQRENENPPASVKLSLPVVDHDLGPLSK